MVTVVPDFSSVGTNEPMTDLKARCDDARPLGLARCDADELLVIYDSKLFYLVMPTIFHDGVAAQLLDVTLQSTACPAVHQVTSVGKRRQLSVLIGAATSSYSLQNSWKFEI